MENSNSHIVCALFLTGILCACSSGTTSPSGQEAVITAAEVTAVPTTEPIFPSPTSAENPAPQETPAPQEGPASQENPALSPTYTLSPVIPRPPIANLPLCNDSLFIDDITIPDMTILKPGEGFVKTWRFRNTGTCEWTTSYAIGFSHGEKMRGNDTKLTKSVNPGGEVDVSVNLTAPMVNGWYGGFWRLRSESGLYFGDFVYISIVVSDGSETSTPGP